MRFWSKNKKRLWKWLTIYNFIFHDFEIFVRHKRFNQKLTFEDCGYVSKWFDFNPNSMSRFQVSVWNQTEPKVKESNRLIFESVWSQLSRIQLKPKAKRYKKLMISSLRCVANIYIYMHASYTACARAKKNFICKIYKTKLMFQLLFS